MPKRIKVEDIQETREKVLTRREKPRLQSSYSQTRRKTWLGIKGVKPNRYSRKNHNDWLEDWNKKELANLKGQGGGPKPKLSQRQKEQLLKLLKERDYWTTTQVKQLIKERFNIEYSDVHIRRTLRAFGLL
ncbi:MAG: helix-turn-helix domain-containing protein, partial [Aquificaceae bacterium]|nr:helix-turn-helix domain-containing protein [Aquificaceae bacterium]